MKAVRIGGKALDVGDRVAGAVTGAEFGAADIHGIGTVLDGLDADLGILGRGEEFEVHASLASLSGPLPEYRSSLR